MYMIICIFIAYRSVEVGEAGEEEDEWVEAGGGGEGPSVRMANVEGYQIGHRVQMDWLS